MTGDPEKESAWIAHAVGLSPDDTEVLLRIMGVHRKEFDAIVRTYNDAASDAQEKTGHPPDPSVVATFKTQRRELVASTRKDLDEALSPAGVSQFHL